MKQHSDTPVSKVLNANKAIVSKKKSLALLPSIHDYFLNKHYCLIYSKANLDGKLNIIKMQNLFDLIKACIKLFAFLTLV